MTQKEMKIGVPGGLEARQVAMLVQIAGNFQSQVYVEYNGRKVNAKSIMGMMSLGLAQGEAITVITDGKDEDQAMKGIVEYLSGKE